MNTVIDFLSDPNNEWIWDPIQAVLVLSGFYLVISQLRFARDQNSISHLNYFREVWNSEPLLRARLATVRAPSTESTELEGFEDVIATFMEDLGAALHTGQASEEHVWNYFSYYVEGYWQILMPKILAYQKKRDDTYFERFKDLFEESEKVNGKHGALSMPESGLFAFREEEDRAVSFMLGLSMSIQN